MQISLFNGFADKNPKPITIREVVEIIRADQRLQVLTENHRRYRSMGDTARADAEKEHMPCYSVAVLFSGGKQQKHIVSYTGLSIVDLDHIPSERMAEVLTLVKADPHTLLAYTTISGEGVRVLFRYEVERDSLDPLRSVAPLSPLPIGSSVAQSTVLPSLGTACHLGNPLTASLRPLKAGTVLSDSLPVDKSAIEQTKENCPSETGGRAEYNDVERSGGGMISANQYLLAFTQGNEYYSNLLHLPYDEKCKDATRISGMAHDPEVYYNPDAVAIIVDMTKKSAGRPRKGTKIERVEENVIRELEQRGVVYAPGSHNKYISDACYMMNRYGVSLGDCTAWALERFSDYQQQGNDVASIVRSCYAQTEEHGTARPPKAEKESRYASIKDIQDWLLKNNVQIRHNVITRKREISFNENAEKDPLLSSLPVKTICRASLQV